MLKFVRQGESGRGLEDEWATVSVAAVPEPKDGEHNCTVCKTRRRSLERQTAGVLRRSRSRETLRSISNSSSSTNEEDVCISEHSKTSHDDSGKQVRGGGRGWGSKGDKYRRLSRSCEALSVSNKATRRDKGDAGEDANHARNGLTCRIQPGTAMIIDGSPLGKELKKSDMDESLVLKKGANSSLLLKKGENRLIPCSLTMTPGCKTRQLSVKETGYRHGLGCDAEAHCRKSVKGLSKSMQGGGASSTGKQVQFGGVEYEKSKEESVMGKLRNAVSSNRGKLRSKSLERIDHRWEWPRTESSEQRKSGVERKGRSRSKSWVQDEPMTWSHGGASFTAQESISDCEHRQLHKNCKRRSRSTSKEGKDRRRDESETRQGVGHLYHYDDNQNAILSQSPSLRDERLAENRRKSSLDVMLPDATVCASGSLQYSSDIRRSVSSEFGRNDKLRRRDELSALIAPHYVAPNGHYGKAVVRKCHREPKYTTGKEPTSRRVHLNLQKPETVSQKGDALLPSGHGTGHKTRNRGRDNERRCSLPKLEKCGISATKIAKLDSPLQLKAPDLSIINKITDGPAVSIVHLKDGEDTLGYSPIQNRELTSHRSRVESCGEYDLDKESSSSGYVYNCTTAKITKLNLPETSDKCVLGDTDNPSSHRNHNDGHISSSTKEKLTCGQSKTNQQSLLGDMRKIEPANDLVRHASVASLSLISVNSVDSGTSCHEGSTTDSSSSASDKEMETQGKQNKPGSKPSTTKQRQGKEAREYMASAKELEHLILASCFGVDKRSANLVTSDYESDTGPDMVRNRTSEDGRRRRGGVSRVVRFVGGKDDMDTREMTRREQSKPKVQAQISSQKSATKNSHHLSDQSSNRLLAKLTTKARVLNSHKAMSKTEMSVQRGDVVYLASEDLNQRPLWVVAYSSSSGEMGFIPSVYLTTSSDRGPSTA